MKVELINHMGSDLSVVNAARVSFAKESDWEMQEGGEYDISEKDIKLINYLAKHNHWSPFAHTSLSLRVKAPLFVARQLAKHQVGLAWNEVSRRYVDEEPEFYQPDNLRSRPDKSIKQGSDASKLYPSDTVKLHNLNSLKVYNTLLEEGVAPEEARMVLPQTMMTEWVWTGSLLAFSRIYNLRSDSHAQHQTQEFAAHLVDVCQPLFPVSWEALTKSE